MKVKSFFLITISIICITLILLSFSKQSTALVNPTGTTIIARFNLPTGYKRITSDKNTFAYYLQHLALKPHGTLVHLYNGEEKNNKVAAAVLNIDVGTKDLQQCADAVMRLRAEYLFESKQFDAIHFNFTNGFNTLYSKWRSGYRVAVKANTTTWIKTTKESTSYQSFKEYLQLVFNYAGTASLAKELKPIILNQLQIGDVFIKGGAPGHAVIVVDMAFDEKTGKTLFMIAQSYMPAQDIHILINKKNSAISPWYELSGNDAVFTPEWTFENEQLKRF